VQLPPSGASNSGACLQMLVSHTSITSVIMTKPPPAKQRSSIHFKFHKPFKAPIARSSRCCEVLQLLLLLPLLLLNLLQLLPYLHHLQVRDTVTFFKHICQSCVLWPHPPTASADKPL